MSVESAAEWLSGLVEHLEGLHMEGPALPQEYLVWVEDCENALRGVFAEPDVMARLHTDRYWHIYADLTSAAIDPGMLDTRLPAPDPCDQETDMQLRFLSELAEQLAHLRKWASRPGRVLVYDTNCLMHYQDPGQIHWTELAKTPQVRLVVPLVVIDELDRKKYAGSDKMARRATAALRALDQLLDGAAPGAAVEVPARPGVSVEVMLDEDRHTRITGADDEIIDRTLLIGQLTAQQTTLITADTGMRLRAQAAGLATLRLPDHYRKDQPPT